MCRNTNIGIFMGRKANSLLPEVISNLKTMGEQIKQARLRRNLSCEVIAQRADISRSTLCEVEKGSPSVAIGTYAAVLNALNGMDTDLLLIAKEDLVNKNSIRIFERFSSKQELPLGTLFIEKNGPKDIFYFEYSREYLEHNEYRFTIDPELKLFEYEQVKLNSFYQSVFFDSLPDSWGRKLIRKKELIDCYTQKRQPNISDVKMLLQIHNDLRIGAMSFKSEFYTISKNEPAFIPSSKHLSILRRLALNFEIGEPFRNQKDFNLLYSCSCSLGGTTPKINMVLPDNTLWIAKFNSTEEDDTILLSRRFDRTDSGFCHIVSAKALLKTDDNSRPLDFLDLAAFIKRHGSKPKQDLNQLFKRIVFSILIGNCNDHIKKYFFILKKDGWKLGPLFDPVPSADGDFLNMCVADGNNIKSLDLALSVHKYFSLSLDEAKEIIRTMKMTIRASYNDLTELYGVKSGEIKIMKDALKLCFI